MRTMFKTLAVAALVAMPAVVSAQGPSSGPFELSVTSHPFSTRGTGFSVGPGGGFLATFTADLGNGSQTFTDYLVWCIDPNRNVAVGGTYSYSAFTFADYAANPTVGPVNGYDITVGDLNAISSIALDLEFNWDDYTATQRQNRQGYIWSRYRGEGMFGNSGFDANGWFVLHGNNRNQTFVVRAPGGSTVVPEPSTFALMGLGFVGLIAARRRKA